jgi:hypothetical protein
VGVSAGREVGEARGALRETGQHGVTVRDGFVTREGKRALQSTGRVDCPCAGFGGHLLPA